jgi:organic hydroperoxide reductase OsmC/OhrA
VNSAAASARPAATDQQRRWHGVSTSHHYEVTVTWTGDLGTGTSSYDDYSRAHEVSRAGQPTILASADTAFRGDPTRWNPEELLVAALSECHMLWYLHLAAVSGVVVVGYTDTPVGTMAEDGLGGASFTSVTLQPVVDVADESMAEPSMRLHTEVNKMCFLARSMNFPVVHEPHVRVRVRA